MSTAVLFQVQSFLILCLLMGGVLAIRKKKVHLHIKMQGTAIVWDVILILQIELGRQAINKASQAMTNPLLLNIHVTIAVLTVLLYILMVRTGIQIKKGKLEPKRRHRFLGYTTLFFRLATFATSFWAVTPGEV